MTNRDRLAGGCQCGAVRYEITASPLDVYICHCTECRGQSSSAFGISVITAVDHFRVVEGRPKCWSRPTASGGFLDCHFCADCGSRLWHRGRGDGVVSIKGGSLDGPVDLSDVAHIWTRSKLPGVVIPSHVRQFAEGPS